MRRNARTAALLALACLPACSPIVQANAAARPTRPRAHEISRKVTPQPVLAEHAFHKTAGRPAHAAAAAAPSHGARAVPVPAKAVPASRKETLAEKRASAHSVHGSREIVALHSRTAPAHQAKLREIAHHSAPASSSIQTIASARVHAWLEQQKTAQQTAIPHANTLRGAKPEPAHLQQTTVDQLPAPAVVLDRHETGTSHPPDFDEELPAPHPATDKPMLGSAADTISSLSRGSELPEWKSVQEEASTPVLLPSLYDKRGHLIMPAALKGSREILLHQNQMADHDGLDRIKDDADLVAMRRKFQLVALPENDAIRIDERLPDNRRYARVWTARFLANMARDHYARFHTALQVNSAVRTVEFQQRLLLTNGNAAPADGDTASPHLTGQAVDIAKRGLPLPEIAWMRAYLAPLIQDGKIDVEEEFQQSCFHISVYKAYLPPGPRMNLATSHHALPVAPLAAAIE